MDILNTQNLENKRQENKRAADQRQKTVYEILNHKKAHTQDN